MSRGHELAPQARTVGVNASPVVAVRFRRGMYGETSRVVHLVALPVCAEAGAVSALCGAMLASDQIETVELGRGMPCMICVLCRSRTLQPTADHCLEGVAEFRRLGWPVSTLDDRVLLTLGSAASALELPVDLAEQTQAILAARHCPAAVLMHADTPEQRIFIAGEPYGTPLPWPATVQVVSGTLPLPPCMTPQGEVTWHYLPNNHILRMCREIDIFAAVRTAWRDEARRSH